jgi:hypothetical protein
MNFYIIKIINIKNKHLFFKVVNHLKIDFYLDLLEIER